MSVLRKIRAGLRSKLTISAIVALLFGLLLEKVAGGALGRWLDQAGAYSAAVVDDHTCRGRAAEAEGDRLTGRAESALKAKDATQAQALFRDANTHYEKAYNCGFPDAGIRLAVAHCMGLGTPKSLPKARQIVLEIEAKYREKTGRAGDVRKLCGM